MKKSLILIAVPALFFLGCKPKPAPGPTTTPNPKACFSMSKSLIDSGETVTTTNCSTGAASYAWNFGLGLQSSFTTTNASYTYKNPARGTVYKVDLVAYDATGKYSNEKDTTVTLGYRRIDSVVVRNIPGYSPTSSSTIALQFGPDANISEFNSPQIAPTNFPFTFNLTGLSPKVYITTTNDGAWKGRVVNITGGGFVNSSTFGIIPGSPTYLSRGLDASPIIVKDGSSPPLEYDFYYSISPVDK